METMKSKLYFPSVFIRFVAEKKAKERVRKKRFQRRSEKRFRFMNGEAAFTYFFWFKTKVEFTSLVLYAIYMCICVCVCFLDHWTLDKRTSTLTTPNKNKQAKNGETKNNKC